MMLLAMVMIVFIIGNGFFLHSLLDCNIVHKQVANVHFLLYLSRDYADFWEKALCCR
jgi:hypothetical protein